jgi:hypothetical protein
MPHIFSTRHAAALALLGALALHANAYEDDPHNTTCRVVRGTIVPVCNGTVCTQGTTTGDLQGRFTSKVTSIYLSGSGWIYSTWMKIDLEGKKGLLDIIGAGTMPFTSARGPDMSQATEVLKISEATGTYQDHSATIVITGGHVMGREAPYIGRLCHRMAPQ